MVMKKFLTRMYHGFLLSFRQIRRSEKNVINFIIYGLLYDLFLNLYKPFSVKFLLRLGGQPFHIYLINSLPGILAVFALIPGSLVISRFRKKKGIISFFFSVSRAFVLMLAFIPFLPEHLRPILFVLLLSAMNFPDAVSQSGLQGFLGDVFDGRTRSQAITLRNKFGQIAVPFVTLITGIIVTYVPKNDAQAINVYQVFFVMAFIVGVLEVIVFRKFKERDDAGAASEGQRPGFKAVFDTLKDKRFIQYTIPTIFFYFMFQGGWPLFSILSVNDLGATEFQIAMISVVSGIFGFIGAGFWGRLIAKKGNEFVTVIAVFNLAMVVFVTAIAPNMLYYIAVQSYGGFVGIGVTITMLNGLLAATPDKNRIIYISVYYTFTNITLGLSPFFASFLYDMLGTRNAMFVIGFGRLISGVILYILYRRHKKKAVTVK